MVYDEKLEEKHIVGGPANMSIMDWVGKVHCGDAFKLLKQMPSESIDCVVTSPPYYGLRVYGGGEVETIFDGDMNCQHEWGDAIPVKEDWRWHALKNETHPNGIKQAKGTIAKDHGAFCIKCGAWRGQLGLEPSWEMYVQHLVELFREVKRVLKKTGSLWLNIGDTYASSKMNWTEEWANKPQWHPKEPKKRGIKGYKSKCLMGIPWRVAFALIDDGWILRNAVIWHKPNAMPSSVKDRLAQTYEYIFHFVKSKRYYYNLDNIREPHRTIHLDKERTNLVELAKLCLKKYEEALKERKAYDHKDGGIVPESFKTISEWNRGARETMNKIIDSLNVSEEVKVKLRSWWHEVQSHPKGKNVGDIWKWNEDMKETSRHHNSGRIRQLTRTLSLPEQNPLGGDLGDAFSIPVDSKYLGLDVKTASPAARAAKTLLSGKITTHVKRRILDVGAYLKSKLRESGLTVKQLSELTGIKQTTLEHYFRTDFSGQALPSREVWNILKPILNLGEYDDYIDEEIRCALPQPHPLGRNPGDFFSLPTKPFKGAHFAVFPPELPLRPILATCPPDGIVLDPLAGSGTVAYTCELINRGMWDEFRIQVNNIAKNVKWNIKWILIEISPEYCKLAEKRLEPFMKQKRLESFININKVHGIIGGFDEGFAC